jgi:peptide/nickel transport system permease protein
MSVFVIRRVLQSLVVLVVMSLLVFFGINVIGDPVDLLISPDADQEDIENAIRALGLDRPIHEQYWYFVLNALQGDLGRSFIFQEPALKLIVQRMPATMELALAAMLLAVFVGIPLGMYAGLRPESRASKVIMAGSILGFSLPTFWVGLMFIWIFAVMLGWLPSTGRGDTTTLLGVEVSFLTVDGLRHLFLPALNLALFKMSLVIRLARAGTREVVLQDYVKFARAKGLSSTRVVLVHVMTIELLDRPVVVAYLLITVLMFVVINLVVDILYSILDPRVRLRDAKS